MIRKMKVEELEKGMYLTTKKTVKVVGWDEYEQDGHQMIRLEFTEGDGLRWHTTTVRNFEKLYEVSATPEQVEQAEKHREIMNKTFDTIWKENLQCLAIRVKDGKRCTKDRSGAYSLKSWEERFCGTHLLWATKNNKFVDACIHSREQLKFHASIIASQEVYGEVNVAEKHVIESCEKCKIKFVDEVCANCTMSRTMHVKWPKNTCEEFVRELVVDE